VSGWVTAQAGTMPLVILAPHGGDLSPDELPTRSCAGCVVINDAETQELAYAIAAAFETRTGKRPFVVVNRLHRRKFDANRELAEATGGYAPLNPLWQLFHDRVDSAKAGALRVHPRVLVLDLHGHAHTKQRLEIGYLLSASQLRTSNDALAPALSMSSIARLAALRPATDTGALLVRGPRALGSRFAALGVPAVPSDVDPAPLAEDPYFSGGYNTERHGSFAGGAVDAIQIESYRVGIRDTPANRALFAETVVTAVLGLLGDYYGWGPK
jgi:N-formylglutamate amidohydrolase